MVDYRGYPIKTADSILVVPGVSYYFVIIEQFAITIEKIFVISVEQNQILVDGDNLPRDIVNQKVFDSWSKATDYVASLQNNPIFNKENVND